MTPEHEVPFDLRIHVPTSGRFARAKPRWCFEQKLCLRSGTARTCSPPTEANPEDGWMPVSGFTAENERYLVEVDPDRGGGISRLYDKVNARELIKPGEMGNELLACDEYPNHPSFGEGPWHLTPDRRRSRVRRTRKPRSPSSDPRSASAWSSGPTWPTAL